MMTFFSVSVYFRIFQIFPVFQNYPFVSGLNILPSQKIWFTFPDMIAYHFEFKVHSAHEVGLNDLSLVFVFKQKIDHTFLRSSYFICFNHISSHNG